MSTCSTTVPSYLDLGKAARDLFCKGYNYGAFKLDLKTKIGSDMELTTSGSVLHETGLVSANLVLKSQAFKEHGVTWSAKSNLDNTIAGELSVEDQPVKGLKVTIDGEFVPLTGKKNVGIRSKYHNKIIHADLETSLNSSCVSASTVAGGKGWFGGVRVSYDWHQSTLTNLGFAFSRALSDYAIYLSMINYTTFQSTIYHKVNDNLEIAIKKGWSTDKTDTKFAVAAKYLVDKDLTLRAKLNNKCQIGFSYQQRVHEAVTLTLSALVEGKRLNQPAHKFGIGLEFEF